MMWNKWLRWGLVALMLVCGRACSYPERAADPAGSEEGTDAVVSIAFLHGRYGGEPFPVRTNWLLRGEVISTDRSGNYYKTLAVDDGTGVVEVKLDAEQLFAVYPPGCRVEVVCNGLTLGERGGVLQLGSTSTEGYETDYIAAEEIGRRVRVIAPAEDEGLQPVVRTLETVAVADLGRLVAVDGVQFVTPGVTWCLPDASDASGFADTVCYVEDRMGRRMAVRTSRRAEFAGWIVPDGSGRIEGLLSLYDGAFQLRVIRPDLLYGTMAEARF